MDAYQPVNNAFKEELEVLAAMKKTCFIKFVGDNGATTAVTSTITGINNMDGIEYLQTESGLQVRLDRIVEIDGQAPETMV